MTTATTSSPTAGWMPRAGHARFAGGLLVTTVTRTAAAALLPPGLGLATAAASQPLVFAFGEQSHGTWFFGGRPLPLGSRYADFGVFVPEVRRAGDSTAYAFVAKMCSGYFPAMWHGNVHYGFRKDVVAARWHGDAWMMTATDGGLLAHAALDPCEPWRASSTDEPLRRDLDAWFARPVLGRRDDGSDVACRFEWDFSTAETRRAAGWMAIDRPFVPGLDPRVYWADADACRAVRGMGWGLSWPRPLTASAAPVRTRG